LMTFNSVHQSLCWKSEVSHLLKKPHTLYRSRRFCCYYYYYYCCCCCCCCCWCV